jgi:hypothetical protein
MTFNPARRNLLKATAAAGGVVAAGPLLPEAEAQAAKPAAPASMNETDPVSSPMKAKGVAELGICGVAAAVANAIYNATGVRVRDYPVTLDKLLEKMPEPYARS